MSIESLAENAAAHEESSDRRGSGSFFAVSDAKRYWSHSASAQSAAAPRAKARPGGAMLDCSTEDCDETEVVVRTKSVESNRGCEDAHERARAASSARKRASIRQARESAR